MKTKRFLPTLVLLITAIGFAAPAAKPSSPPVTKKAAAAPATPVRVTSVEGITEYRLANGLQVLLFPDPTKPTATVNVTYKVGSRDENYGETGMAHLLEHLMFKGTPKHTNIYGEMTAPATTRAPGSIERTTSRRSMRAMQTFSGRSSSKRTGWFIR
jgi:zinc protease